MWQRSNAHDGPAARLRAAARAAGPFEPASVVVAVAAGAATPTAHQLSADAHPVRYCSERGNAGAYAVVAHAASPHARSGADSRSCWTDLESADRDLAIQGASRAPDRRRMVGRGRMGPAPAH